MLSRTVLSLTQCSAWLSAVPYSPKLDSVLSRTVLSLTYCSVLSLNQCCPAQSSAWLSAIPYSPQHDSVLYCTVLSMTECSALLSAVLYSPQLDSVLSRTVLSLTQCSAWLMLSRTALSMTQFCHVQHSAWLSAVLYSAQHGSVLSRTAFSMTQCCPVQSSAWLSAVPYSVQLNSVVFITSLSHVCHVDKDMKNNYVDSFNLVTLYLKLKQFYCVEGILTPEILMSLRTVMPLYDPSFEIINTTKRKCNCCTQPLTIDRNCSASTCSLFCTVNLSNVTWQFHNKNV